MKIALMTIQSVNCGNRLQNYALQTVLERMGHQVDSLRREAGYNGSLRCGFRAIRHVFGAVKHHGDQIGAFSRFDQRHISFSSATVSKAYVTPGFDSAYDAYVIGSDQVWNPDLGCNSELEYLPMVATSKKVAYAASYGVNEISFNRLRTAEFLNGVASISMREHAGARIVGDLTGRKAPVVLDPTMLLSTADWAKVALKPKTVDCDKPYIFKYVLGTDANEKAIAELAEAQGLEIIDFADESLGFGPSEFVWFASHSALVCTDSFHASVFALLHHKPLAIFERVSAEADMSSRFDTLCSLFNLTGHRSSESSFGADSIYGTDWDAFEARLAELRAFSLGWLGDALKEVAHG